MVKFNQARDMILQPFWDVWEPLGFRCVFDDLPDKNPSNQIWARATLKHINGRQGSLSSFNDITDAPFLLSIEKG